VVERSDSPHPPSTGPEIGRAAEAASDLEGPRVVSRRWMLLKAGIALNGLIGIGLAIPIVRYLFSPIRPDSAYNSWVSLGVADSFPMGETRLISFTNPWRRPWDGQTVDIPCYVRRTGKRRFQVFAINCAHLGCPVRWFPQSQLFMCPCHGGVYYADGSRASGPPTRGLFTYPNKVVAGNLQIYAGQMPTLSNVPKPPESAKLVNIAAPRPEGDCSCRG
jgi:nitrite reductase/ring-hydroxylating ferredoxin subunit